MCCSKSSVDHLYFMIKKFFFFILWQWNWYFCYCEIINLWWDIQYLVYNIIHTTYKTNDRRRITISIFDIYNDIVHNVKEVNSFGCHLANYICKVLVTMLRHFHPIFLNNKNIFLMNSNVTWSSLILSISVWKSLLNLNWYRKY